MTAFKTCRSCISKGNCEIQDRMRVALKGLHISSLLHRCGSHAPPYRKGQAIWAYVMDAPYDADGPDPVRRWFPGHFSSVARNNTRAIVRIAPDVLDREGEEDFIPMGKGFCKVIWASIEPRDAPDIGYCPKCDALEGMECEGDTWSDSFICHRPFMEPPA